MKKIFLYILPITFLFIVNCGFKIENYSKLSNFAINNISSEGDQRINYKLKNALLFKSNKNSEKLIDLNFSTKKNKSIKEKNIKNEITKYLIDVSVNVTFNENNSQNTRSFTISKSSYYDVNSQYSQTLNNEKKLIETLTDKISQEIFDKLVLEINAL